MRDSVKNAFPAFIERWEGRCTWLYLDTKGLVTTGVGNLVDDGTPGPACGLPWVHAAGGRAMLDDVVAAWHKVKAAQSMAPLGGGHFAGLTDIRLLSADVDALVQRKLAQIESVLRGGFPNWDGFPAPAQLAILDMGWNMGPGFGFPKFRAYCNAQNWLAASTECQIQGAPPMRNAAHVSLFLASHDLADPDLIPSV